MTTAPTTPMPASNSALETQHVRSEFPALTRQINGRPLVYLDSAATSHKPQAVLNAMHDFYVNHNANIHRGVHTLSVEATDLYESARRKSQKFINASRPEELIFVRGTTEGMNLIAQSFARPRLQPGDEILISHMEHHSNIVPWQLVCEQAGAVLKVIPITDEGELELDTFRSMLSDRTKLVSIVHVSNTLGTINPIGEMVTIAHERGIPVAVDGAQAAPHQRVDVQALGCDFYTISGHKMFAPTGSGILYGRYDLLDAMPPYHGGGEMILSVSFEKTTYNKVPHKFEAGTPNIAGAVGLGAAVDFLDRIGYDAIGAHEHELLDFGTRVLNEIPDVRIIGTAPQKASVLTFTLRDIHPHDVGTVLDQRGIAVRTGHHCTQPLMERFGVTATVRASMALYNTINEIDQLADGLREVLKVFR